MGYYSARPAHTAAGCTLGPSWPNRALAWLADRPAGLLEPQLAEMDYSVRTGDIPRL